MAYKTVQDRGNELSRRIKDAWFDGDSGRYVETCLDAGIVPEDSYLVERDQADRIASDLNRAEIRGPKKYNLSQVAQIALARFPELERGESIYDKEIRRRLRDIRKTGYDVPTYSGLNKEEAWGLLMRLRGAIAGEARRECPLVLNMINSKNEARRLERAL